MHEVLVKVVIVHKVLLKRCMLRAYSQQLLIECTSNMWHPLGAAHPWLHSQDTFTFLPWISVAPLSVPEVPLQGGVESWPSLDDHMSPLDSNILRPPEMASILLTTFSNVFSQMKTFEF